MLWSRGYVTQSAAKIFGISEISVSLQKKKYPNWMSFSSLNCTRCVSHRGICIGNESLFSRHGLCTSIFSGTARIEGVRVGDSGIPLIIAKDSYRMPEITLKKNTIYLNKYIRTETDRTTFFYLSKKLVLALKDKERAATAGVRRHAPPETPFL